MGQALYEAQLGGKHRLAKPMSGDLSDVVEIRVAGPDGNAYRTVYVAKLGGRVYGLHAFVKKSTKGIQTPQHVRSLIKERLKEARRAHAELTQ
jgi:phage-related protein